MLCGYTSWACDIAGTHLLERDRISRLVCRYIVFRMGIKTLCGILDALECDVNVEDYPNVMHKAGREKEAEPPQQQHEDEQQEEQGQPRNRGDGRHKL
jgi:hypothetical protein